MLSAVLVLAWAQGGLMKQVVGVPTGRNGYEDLVAAAQLLQNRRFGDYLALDLAPQTERTHENAEVLDALRGKSFLQRRRWAIERYGAALDLLLAASRKPISDPRAQIDVDTLFPELAGFKDVAKLVSHAAYVAFADGKSERAVDLWRAGLDVFDRANGRSLIQYLVGVACTAIVLASVEANLSSLSETDARTLEALSVSLTERPPGILAAMDGECDFMARSLAKLGSDDGMLDLLDEEESRHLRKAWAAFSETERQRAKSILAQRISDHRKRLAAKFSGPEHQWVEDDLEEPTAQDRLSPESFADGVTAASFPLTAQVGITAARTRTQVRLLGLTAAVVRFRWEPLRMPASLEEVVGRERSFDPLSELPFELKREGPAGFSVVSRGVKQTGEIALRYRRPAGSPAIDP